jgi:hypothetical protein
MKFVVWLSLPTFTFSLLHSLVIPPLCHLTFSPLYLFFTSPLVTLPPCHFTFPSLHFHFTPLPHYLFVSSSVCHFTFLLHQLLFTSPLCHFTHCHFTSLLVHFHFIPLLLPPSRHFSSLLLHPCHFTFLPLLPFSFHLPILSDGPHF